MPPKDSWETHQEIPPVPDQGQDPAAEVLLEIPGTLDSGQDEIIVPPEHAVLQVCKDVFQKLDDMDFCHEFASNYLQGCRSGCCPSLDMFQTCMQNAQSSGFTSLRLIVDLAGCHELSVCWLHPEWRLLRDLDGIRLRALRNLLYQSFLLGEMHSPETCGLQADEIRLKTGLLLDSYPCLCSWNRDAHPAEDCTTLLADMLSLADRLAVGPCLLLEDPIFARILDVDTGLAHQQYRLTDLDCLQRRNACTRVLESRCGQPATSDHFAIEECVATVESLRCRCLREPGSTGCDATVANLSPCVVTDCTWLEEEHCAFMCNKECFPPDTTNSGIDSPGPVARLDEATLRAWCEWRSCLTGGPGYRPVDSDSNTNVTVQPTVDECVQDLQATFMNCDTSLAEVESCTRQLHGPHVEVSDWLGRFGYCAFTGDYSACHLIFNRGADQRGACYAVANCMEQEWNIIPVFSEPD